MERAELITKLLSGYNIKSVGGKYYLVAESDLHTNLEELTQAMIDGIELDVVDEKKNTTWYCIDISFFNC